jgi:hypothetical protein
MKNNIFTMKQLLFFFGLLLVNVIPAFSQIEYAKVYGMDDKQLAMKPQLENEAEAMKWIYDNNRFLQTKKELGKHHKVTVVFTIDKEGNLSEPFVISGIGRPYDGESIRLIKDLPFEWIPGKINDENVDAKASLTISFMKR